MSPRFTLCRTTHHPVQPALGRLSRLHTGLHTRLPTRLRSAGLIAWLARPGWLLLLAAAPGCWGDYSFEVFNEDHPQMPPPIASG